MINIIVKTCSDATIVSGPGSGSDPCLLLQKIQRKFVVSVQLTKNISLKLTENISHIKDKSPDPSEGSVDAGFETGDLASKRRQHGEETEYLLRLLFSGQDLEVFHGENSLHIDIISYNCNNLYREFLHFYS